MDGWVQNGLTSEDGEDLGVPDHLLRGEASYRENVGEGVDE